MELQPIENPVEIAEEAIRIADQLRILEIFGSSDEGLKDQSEVQHLHGVFKKIDAEMGKLKLSCLRICLTNSRNHHSAAVLHMLDELTLLSGEFNNLIKPPSSIPETSTEEQSKRISNQNLIVKTEHCLQRISRTFYAWRQ